MKNKLLLIGGGAGLLGLILYLILAGLAGCGVQLWLGIGSQEIGFLLLFLGIASATVCGGLAVFFGCRSLWCRVLIVLLLVLVLLLVSVFFFAKYVWNVAGTYYAVSSPDGEYTIVVREREFLFASWGAIYQLTSPVTMVEVGEYWLHDLFPRGDYDIVWMDTYFEITVGGQTQKIDYR